MPHRGEGNNSILDGAPSKEMRPNELHKHVANVKNMAIHWLTIQAWDGIKETQSANRGKICLLFQSGI